MPFGRTAQPTVLVTGATGCLGRPTVEGLARAGYRVRAGARSPDESISSLVQPICIDITDTESVRKAMNGVDIVVHLAGKVHRCINSPLEAKDMRTINSEGTYRVADEARRARVSRLILASSVAVYGDNTQPRALDESTACHPCTVYGQTKYAAEKHWLEAGGIVLRLPLVFGAFDKGNAARLLRLVRAGRVMVVGRGDNRKSVVYSGNVADRIVLLSSLDGVSADTFNVVDSSPTQQELILAMSHVVGRQPPVRVPARLAQIGGAFLDSLNRAYGRTAHWQQDLLTLTRHTEFDGRRLDCMLRNQPRVSLPDGLARVLHWLSA